jgi:hypothetical protein
MLDVWRKKYRKKEKLQRLITKDNKKRKEKIIKAKKIYFNNNKIIKFKFKKFNK